MPLLEVGQHCKDKWLLSFTEVSVARLSLPRLFSRSCPAACASAHAQLCVRLPGSFNVLKGIKDGGTETTVPAMTCCFERALKELGRTNTRKARKNVDDVSILREKGSPLIRILPPLQSQSLKLPPLRNLLAGPPRGNTWPLSQRVFSSLRGVSPVH